MSEYVFENETIKIDKDLNLIIPINKIDWKEVNSIFLCKNGIDISYKHKSRFIIRRNDKGILSYTKTVNETIG